MKKNKRKKSAMDIAQERKFKELVQLFDKRQLQNYIYILFTGFFHYLFKLYEYKLLKS